MQRKFVVCFYTDFGNHGYIPLMRRMCESAKAVIPNVETVLLTPGEDPELESYFDHWRRVDLDVRPDNLCASRGRVNASWQMQSKGLTYFVDPDIVFQREPEIDPDADILFSWRQKSPAQPINAGMVIAKPGCMEFWKKYARCAINLPKPLDAWWCDQLAYNLLVGLSHQTGDYVRVHDATVKLVDSSIMCAPAEEGSENSWALHYKGKRKWNQESMHSQEKSGDGSQLAACA